MLGAGKGFGMRVCTGYALGIPATNKPMQQSFKMHVERNSRHLKRLSRSLFKRDVSPRAEISALYQWAGLGRLGM